MTATAASTVTASDATTTSGLGDRLGSDIRSENSSFYVVFAEY